MIFLPIKVELGESPINELDLFSLRIYNYIARLHITVHNALRVTVLETFKYLVHYILDVL